jgi:hypothetical protein
MDDTLDLALLPAGLKQDACSFHMGLMIQLCRNTGMIEATYKVIDGSYAVNRLLHLLLIGNLASDNRDSITELGTRFFCIAGKDAHRLLLLHQFCNQGSTEKACRACNKYGHWRAPE